MSDKTIREILEFDIVKELGIRDEKQKEKVLTELSEIFFERLMEEVVPMLSDEKIEEFNNKLTEDISVPEIIMLLGEEIDNLDEIIGKHILEIKTESVKLLN